MLSSAAGIPSGNVRVQGSVHWHERPAVGIGAVRGASGRVRAFARACGYEAKTDPLDAQVLSRYGVVFSESDAKQPEADPDREELRQLLSRRRQLVEQRVRERNRLDKGVSASVGDGGSAGLTEIDRKRNTRST